MNNKEFEKIANDYNELTKYNFIIKVGNSKKKIIDFVISFNINDFSHIIGLDHLTDIKCFNTHNSYYKQNNFQKIKCGDISFEYIEKTSHKLFEPVTTAINPITNLPYTIVDRIDSLSNIENYADNFYSGQLAKWNLKKANKLSSNINISIRADYVISIPSDNHLNEKIYFFMYQTNKKADCREQPIKLQVFSAFPNSSNLIQGQEKPFTILQLTKKISRHRRKSCYTFIHLMKIKYLKNSGSFTFSKLRR